MAKDLGGRAKASVAGIVDDPETKSRIIPESRRADGSIRKERRVKPGFTPAEDIGRFRPSRVLRAEAEARQQGKETIPGYESPAIETARRAMAGASISTSSPSSAVASPANNGSDSDWRRSAGENAFGAVSRGGWRGASGGRGSGPSTSTIGTRPSDGNWRSREKPAKTEEVPDDWEQEESSESVEGKVEIVPSSDGKTGSSTEAAKESHDEEEDAKKARSLSKKIRAARPLQEKQKRAGESLLPEQKAKVDSLDSMIRDLKTLGIDEEGNEETT